MNQDQVKALIRETVTAIAALVSTFNIGNDQQLADVSALVIGASMIVWSICAGSPIGSTLIRKAAQAVAPVLVSFSVLNTEQGAAATGVLLALVGIWTALEKK